MTTNIEQFKNWLEAEPARQQGLSQWDVVYPRLNEEDLTIAPMKRASWDRLNPKKYINDDDKVKYEAVINEYKREREREREQSLGIGRTYWQNYQVINKSPRKIIWKGSVPRWRNTWEITKWYQRFRTTFSTKFINSPNTRPQSPNIKK